MLMLLLLKTGIYNIMALLSVKREKLVKQKKKSSTPLNRMTPKAREDVSAKILSIETISHDFKYSGHYITMRCRVEAESIKPAL